MTAISLYQLSAAYQTLLLDDDDPEAEDDTRALLDGLTDAIERKAESVVAVVRTLEALADAADEEEQRLAARKERWRERSAWLRGYLLEAMKQTGMERIQTGRCTLSIRQNPPAVVVVDETQVPREFFEQRISWHLKKSEILARIKEAGECVPGIEVRRGERVQIA